MAIKAKINDREIEEFISRGGQSAKKINPRNHSTHINLRIPIAISERIDNALLKHPGMTRTGYIIESINKFLKEDERE